MRIVNLKPGGYHVMLIGIKRELKAGERVPLKLTVRDAKGVKSTLQVLHGRFISLEIRSRAAI